MDINNICVNFALSLFLLVSNTFIPCEPAPLIQPSQPYAENTINATITILFDNKGFDSRLATGWGFACLVQGMGKNILFDTGRNSLALLQNMRQLEIEPANFDIIVLSHIHTDHTGGLRAILMRNRDAIVYLPASFSQRFKQAVTSFGVCIKEVSEAQELLSGVYTSGELGNEIKEQALVIKTIEGLVIITGCAHPGLVDIIRKAKEITGEERVHLVLGGFHLAAVPPSKLKNILRKLRHLSVKKVAPCHCSGDETRCMFKEEYGADYIECFAGKRITVRIR
jgi:7,8-dihydropterin-6-yl-methyl-4-(beta-D-ribofuranosyl)aminobenzene 5'-phosphate synthase